MNKGITLIGMPGSGKTTIGKRLAKTLQKKFVDLDLLIKEQTGIRHSDVLRRQGKKAFLQLEESIVLSLSLYNRVFAPSGSIVYSKRAMKKIQKETHIFYLKVAKEILKNRLKTLITERGIVGLEELGFDTLFETRSELYKEYADKVVDTKNLTKGKITETILQML